MLLVKILPFFRKDGRTKHMRLCKATGYFERGDINPFVCSLCGYVANSSRGLTQHQMQGNNCQDRMKSTICQDRTKSTMSTLELTASAVGTDNDTTEVFS